MTRKNSSNIHSQQYATTRRRKPIGFILAAITAIAASWANHGLANAPADRYMIANGTVYDTKTKLKWQQIFSPATYTWDEAITHCTNLNLNETGWRLPSIKELQTIVDETRYSPAIDSITFPNTPNEYFFASTPVTGDPVNVWIVNFYTGGTYYFPKGNQYRARCVHD